MEAPEKIYIDDFGSELSYDWHTEHCYESDIEYIRKDVFIEKVRKYIANHFLAPGMDNEINDFVNYMKGE